MPAVSGLTLDRFTTSFNDVANTHGMCWNDDCPSALYGLFLFAFHMVNFPANTNFVYDLAAQSKARANQGGQASGHAHETPCLRWQDGRTAGM